ncbi:alpha-L-fucosidase [Aestuariivivens sediminicola]|uniref:alpha-L-fucosidase n=1 Tax=Aestuariivivens sediminicola TaxID=2913560 RepID=UPI001F578822|nr:alpha-L-fucosidase [Aestuariivivens sediminicola]
MYRACIILIVLFIFQSCDTTPAPEPHGPLPSQRQLDWHDMEYYAFIHFNMNTFTNMEWGDGSEKPEQFNPTQLDTRQWAKTIKDAGMKGVILTAKHHDGFCLWPSAYTEHSVKNSPWKNGSGDVLKELAEACKAYDLKMGVYLSPWDRNHAAYGRPEYVTYFHNQLRELLTQYGAIFEVWFDGANGGSGYYGGANETRKIDNKIYYQWDKVIAIVRELQPNAVIFGDGGPGVRWVGNEEGWANETNWCLLRRDEIYPGTPKYIQLRSGHEDGTHWIPAECDVSIRPGWYYHAAEDTQVKSLDHLVRIYYESIGRNASLLLNLPVDDRGLIHENDIKQLMALKAQIDKDFAENLAVNTQVTASNVRGDSRKFQASHLIDGNPATYWATDDGITSSSITLSFDQPTRVNRILLEEYIPLGQRVKAFTVEAKENGTWKLIDEQTTIGNKRILRFDTIETTEVRVSITSAKAAITLSNIALYHAPNLLTQPEATRDVDGQVTLSVADKNIEIYYTTDGSEPTTASKKYNSPFLIDRPTTLKAMAYNPEDQVSTKASSWDFDIIKNDWKILEPLPGESTEAGKIIDENKNTYWVSAKGSDSRHVVIDLGRTHLLRGFTYAPMQGRWPTGIITHYRFHVSNDNRNWTEVAQGEFGNIKNNPIEQVIPFSPVKGRFIKLEGEKIVDNAQHMSIAELGVLTGGDKQN